MPQLRSAGVPTTTHEVDHKGSPMRQAEVASDLSVLGSPLPLRSFTAHTLHYTALHITKACVNVCPCV